MYDLVSGQQKREKPSSPYFRTYIERWFELYKEPKLRQTTKSSYRNIIKNHLIPHFKGMRMEEITTSTVQELFNAKSSMDVKTLQSIAGHSDIKMTLDRYAHKRETNIIAAGGLISSVFRSM